MPKKDALDKTVILPKTIHSNAWAFRIRFEAQEAILSVATPCDMGNHDYAETMLMLIRNGVRIGPPDPIFIKCGYIDGLDGDIKRFSVIDELIAEINLVAKALKS